MYYMKLHSPAVKQKIEGFFKTLHYDTLPVDTYSVHMKKYVFLLNMSSYLYITAC